MFKAFFDFFHDNFLYSISKGRIRVIILDPDSQKWTEHQLSIFLILAFSSQDRKKRISSMDTRPNLLVTLSRVDKLVVVVVVFMAVSCGFLTGSEHSSTVSSLSGLRSRRTPGFKFKIFF